MTVPAHWIERQAAYRKDLAEKRAAHGQHMPTVSALVAQMRRYAKGLLDKVQHAEENGHTYGEPRDDTSNSLTADELMVMFAGNVPPKQRKRRDGNDLHARNAPRPKP